MHPQILDIMATVSTWCFNAEALCIFHRVRLCGSYDFHSCRCGICNGLPVCCKVRTETETISTPPQCCLLTCGAV